MVPYWRTGPPQPALRGPGRWRLERQGPVRPGRCLRMHASASRFRSDGSLCSPEWGRAGLGGRLCSASSSVGGMLCWYRPDRGRHVLSQRPPRKLSIRSDAGVAKLADAQDLKSWDSEESCGFDSRPRHSRRTSFAFHPGCGYQLFSARAAIRLGRRGRFPPPAPRHERTSRRNHRAGRVQHIGHA